MADGNIITSQDVTWAGTGWSTTKFLRGDGTWADPIAIQPAYSNVVFIAKNGDDTTALAAFTAASNKGVLAYPFLTIAAARSAVSGAGTASATNRWLGKIMGGGTWTEQLVLLSYMDWDLGNAIIDLQAGALYTIDDNNVACDSIIYGNAQILRSTAGTLGCIRTQNASTTLRVNADYIYSSRQYCLRATGGTIVINSREIKSDHFTSYCDGGTITINSNIIGNSSSAVIEVITGTTTVNGNINNTSSGSGAENLGGTLEINGNVVTSATIGVNNDVGTTTVNGNISNSSGTPAQCASGTLTINNSRIVATGVNQNAILKASGTLILNGCILIATGTGKSILATGAETVKIYGTCVANADVEATDVTLQGGEFIVDPTAVYGVSVGTIIT